MSALQGLRVQFLPRVPNGTWLAGRMGQVKQAVCVSVTTRVGWPISRGVDLCLGAFGRCGHAPPLLACLSCGAEALHLDCFIGPLGLASSST